MLIIFCACSFPWIWLHMYLEPPRINTLIHTGPYDVYDDEEHDDGYKSNGGLSANEEYSSNQTLVNSYEDSDVNLPRPTILPDSEGAEDSISLRPHGAPAFKRRPSLVAAFEVTALCPVFFFGFLKWFDRVYWMQNLSTLFHCTHESLTTSCGHSVCQGLDQDCSLLIPATMVQSPRGLQGCLGVSLPDRPGPCLFTPLMMDLGRQLLFHTTWHQTILQDTDFLEVILAATMPS